MADVLLSFGLVHLRDPEKHRIPDTGWKAGSWNVYDAVCIGPRVGGLSGSGRASFVCRQGGGRGGVVRDEGSEYLTCNTCTRPGHHVSSNLPTSTSD